MGFNSGFKGLNIHEAETFRTAHRIPLNGAYSLSSLPFSMSLLGVAKKNNRNIF